MYTMKPVCSTITSLSDSYFSDSGNTSGTVQYSFNSPTDIGAFYLWNGGTTDSPVYGVKDFALEFFNGAISLGSTGTLTAESIQSAPHAAEIFTGFQYSNVTDIQLQTFNNHGTTSYYSINEVGFNTSPVPVPAAVWLFGSGLIALLGLKRKRATVLTA